MGFVSAGAEFSWVNPNRVHLCVHVSVWTCFVSAGADITDYFNYGFTEETWQQYCEKQRRLIAMNDGIPKIVVSVLLVSKRH